MVGDLSATAGLAAEGVNRMDGQGEQCNKQSRVKYTTAAWKQVPLFLLADDRKVLRAPASQSGSPRPLTTTSDMHWHARTQHKGVLWAAVLVLKVVDGTP